MDGAKLTQDRILLCALYEFHQGKPVYEAYQNFCKTMGDEAMTYRDFDYWHYRFANGQFDLDYDRSQDPETREFSDLPIKILEKVVDKSDCKEKLILQDVSSTFRSLVDNVKHSFKCISFFIEATNAELRFDGESVKYPKGTNWQKAFRNLALTLKWSKMKIETFWMQFYKNLNEADMRKAIDETNKMFSYLNNKISIKKILLDVKSEEGALAVLPYLKPGILEVIETNYCQNEQVNLHEVIELDQWKQAKVLTTGRGVDLPIESVLHFKRFDITLQKMSIDEFIMMRNALLTSPTFHHCEVEVESNTDFNSLSNAFEDEVIPIPETNQSLEIRFDFFDRIIEFNKRPARHLS